MINLIRTSAASALALMTAIPALAATNGALGPTSTGTADVSVTLIAAPATEIQVHSLDDLSFANDIEVGSTAIVSSNQASACVWATEEQTNYTLEVSAPAMNGQATGEKMGYSLLISTTWVGDEDFPETSFTSGDTHIIPDLLAAAEQTCAEDDASLDYRVEIDPTDATFPTAPDTYAALLTFLVTPQ